MRLTPLFIPPSLSLFHLVLRSVPLVRFSVPCPSAVSPDAQGGRMQRVLVVPSIICAGVTAPLKCFVFSPFCLLWHGEPKKPSRLRERLGERENREEQQ